MSIPSSSFYKPIPPSSSWWTTPDRKTWQQATQTEWPRMRVVPDRRIPDKTIGWHGVMGTRQ